MGKQNAGEGHAAGVGGAGQNKDQGAPAKASGGAALNGAGADVSIAELAEQLAEAADLFFMNANEANGLFGSFEKARPTQGRLLFVTQGERGAWVIESDRRTHVAAVPVAEVDPTGAGDTFCGATLAHLALGDEPVSAARKAVALAAKAVGQLGPGALF